MDEVLESALVLLTLLLGVPLDFLASLLVLLVLPPSLLESEQISGPSDKLSDLLFGFV